MPNPLNLSPTRRLQNSLNLHKGWLPNLLIAILLLIHPRQSNSSSDSISLQQIFNTIDVNHDHSISQEEYEAAISRWISGSKASGNAEARSVSAAGNNGGAPPLGLDSNHFTYRRNNKSAASPNRGAETGKGGSSSKNDESDKFDNPQRQTRQFLKALFSSFSAIIATEIGDKTFFIAAVLSMRNDRMAVFGGAILALIVMTVLRYVFFKLVLE